MVLWVLIAVSLLLAAHAALAVGLVRLRLRDRPPDRRTAKVLTVSIVVVVKNEERGLSRLMQSLAAQTRSDFELIFVDDGSTDETAQLLSRFQEQDPDRIRVVSGRAPLGGRTAKQRRLDEGIAASAGEIILLTDGDCTVPPRWLEHMCGYFTDADVGAVFGQLSVREGGGWLRAQQAFDLPLFQCFAAGSAGLGVPTGGCGNNQAVRRTALAQVGGFAGLGFTLTEDTALVGELRERGWSVRVSTRPSGATQTEPQRTLRGLYQQRLRWMGGLWHAADRTTRVVARGYAVICLAALLAALLSPVWPALLLWPGALLSGVLSLATVGAVLQGERSLRWFVRAVPAACGFVLVQAVLACLMHRWGPSPVWKGRRLALRPRGGEGDRPPAALTPGRRQAFWEGARVGVLGLGLALAAAVPSQWVLAQRAMEAGADRWAALASSIARDLAVLCIPVSALVALCLACRRRSRVVGRVVLSLFALALWCFMVAATESSLSRGVFPSWVDVGGRWQSADLVRGSASMFLLTRNVVPAAAMIVVGLVLMYRWPRPTTGRRPTKMAGALAAGGSLLVLSEGCLHSFTPTAAATPLEIFTVDALPEARACLLGPCEPGALLQHHDVPDRSANRGAAMLGWPPPAVTPPHPFARRFPAVESSGPTESAARPIVTGLLELSEELFAASDEPLHVWQLVLEGVRGDDLYGVNRAAPRKAAPFLAALYEQAAAGAPGVLASRRTWTAGVRTPHGVAALTCGLGTLPYRLALPRDLPRAHVRCLPDVLADAGFSNGYAYGGAIEFDGMGEFLAAHGVAPRVTAHSLGAVVAQGSWGASDRAVFAAAAAAAPRQGSTYDLVISLSHHHPFERPDDTPPDAVSRAKQAFASASAQADGTDEKRLLTLAYTDEAIRELFERLSQAGLLDRSIIVIAADHSIPERALWHQRPGAIPLHHTRGLLPWVMWISPRLFERASHPVRAREIGAAIGHQLARMPLSQNDTPTLLLALLERFAPVRALPPQRGWHSMGGQATSPWYVAPGPPTTRVHGIHAATALFFVDARGASTAPDEPAPLVVTPRRARHVTPSLHPAVAALRQLPGAP